MRKKKPEELIPPSPNCGVLNSELLRIILPDVVAARRNYGNFLRVVFDADANRTAVRPGSPWCWRRRDSVN